MTQDMTTGSPLRLIVLFSIPLLIGNVFQQLYSMVDTLIVGRALGKTALAAVGATGPMCFLVLGFFFGLTSGCAVITAQRFGAEDDTGVRRSVTTSAIICGVITLIGTIASVTTCKPLLRLMNTPDDILEMSALYVNIIYFGIVTIVFYNMLSGIIRALGDSRTPLFFLVIASVLNIALDLAFIYLFGWGVAGAAWATVLSQASSGFLCLAYVGRKFPILRLHREDWRFSWRLAWEHLYVAIPMALQFSIIAVGTIVLQAALNTFGSTAVAGFTAACKIEQVAVQPMISFGVAMATFTAQNYGARKYNRIRKGVRKCSLLTICISLAGCFSVVAFGRALVEMFIGGNEPEVEHFARTYLNTGAPLYPVLGMLFIYRNTLQGMGKSIVPMIAGAMELLMRSLGAFAFAGWFGFWGVCLAGPLAWLGAAVPLGLAFHASMRKLLRGRNCRLRSAALPAAAAVALQQTEKR